MTVLTGAYPGGHRPGAQWVINFGALEQSWRMAPSTPLSAVNLAPLKFFLPWSPSGRPCLCLDGALFGMLIYLFLSFFFLSFFSSLFLSISFPFSSFFGASLVRQGAKAPQSPQDTHLVKTNDDCLLAMFWWCQLICHFISLRPHQKWKKTVDDIKPFHVPLYCVNIVHSRQIFIIDNLSWRHSD